MKVYTNMDTPKKYKREYNVYYIVNDVDDKVYVGSTVTTLWHRMSQHRADARKGEKSPLYDLMRQYGAEHFKIVLVRTADAVRIREMEEQAIADIPHERRLNYKCTCVNDTSVHFDYAEIVEVYRKCGSKNMTSKIIGCSRPTVSKALRKLSPAYA